MGILHDEAEDDDRYWKYVLARFSAYRNVWWSLANEYDLMHEKRFLTGKDMLALSVRRILIIISDPFITAKRIMIITCPGLPLQYPETETYRSSELVNEWREKYHKPVILDEICYEGNIQFGWGNISGEEMTRRFWEAFCAEDIRDTVKHISVRIVFSGGLMAAFFTEPHRSVSDFLQKSWKNTGTWCGTYACKWDEVAAALPVSRQGKIILFTIIPLCDRASGFLLDDTTEYQVEIIDTWK